MWPVLKALDDYQVWTETTAIYPREHWRSYLALGIADEAGELLEKIEHYTTGTRRPHVTELMDEAGDVLWYAAQLLNRIGTTFGLLPVDRIARSEHEATIVSCTHFVVIHAAYIAGRAKKNLRDGAVVDGKIIEAITKLMLALDSLCNSFGYSLAVVAARNMDKLGGRKDRGVLGGDGDKR